MTKKNAQPEVTDLIDPDPFTVTSLFVGAAALVLQFLQTVKAYEGAKPGSSSQNNTHLARLEEHIEDLQRELKAITRVIDRGSQDPDSQFYDVGFRVSLGIMKFDAKWHGEYTSKLSESYAKVSALARWINVVIGQNASLAVRLGEVLQNEVADAPERINRLIADGAPNRAVLFEVRRVLDVLQRAVTTLLDDRSN